MKTLQTFMGSLLLAIAIALFVPSTAQATWGNYNYSTTTNTTTSNDCSQYEKKAAYYLKKYYKSYNYYDYKCYVYYTKKSKQCKQCTKPTIDCNKYKVLADKYKALYKKCHYYSYYRYYCYYNNLYKKCQAKYNTVGSVCGILFSDLDGDGVKDTGENGYSGATITITDAEGTIHTVTTDSDGKYCQEGVARGEAEIAVDITTLPENASITTGTIAPINVVGNKENTVSDIGFEIPQPIGSISGTVYADTNNNGIQDNNEIGAAGIKVKIVDSNGVTHIATTTETGTYFINNIPEGAAVITVDTETLPYNASLTSGQNPNTITVIGNIDNDAGTDGYINP